ncbi:MAG: TVP38/TMEM64 family protein [Methyloceanibacter sp.]
MGLAPDKEGGGVAWLKRLWPLLLLLAAAGLILAMGWQRYLTLQELVLRREALRAAIAGHPLLALVVFMAIYAGTVALSLPGGAVLTLAGGFLFGWFWGGLASIVAAALGAIIVFLVARSALGEPFAARAGPWLGRLRQGFQEDAFNYLLFLRLVPVFPFWLVNLAPALLGVGLSTYVLATLIGIIPGSFAYSIAGRGLDSLIAAQQAAHQSCLAKMGPDAEKSCPFVLEPGALLTPGLLAGFVALGLVALIPIAVKRFKRRAS